MGTECSFKPNMAKEDMEALPTSTSSSSSTAGWRVQMIIFRSGLELDVKGFLRHVGVDDPDSVLVGRLQNREVQLIRSIHWSDPSFIQFEGEDQAKPLLN